MEHGKKGVKITKKNKPLPQWNSFDFATYFYNKCDNIYGPGIVERNIEKDGMIMKRIKDYFVIENRVPPRMVKRFINWAIDDYVNNNSFTTPVTIGYISFRKEKYLGKHREEKEKAKKKKIQPVVLESEEESWANEQIRYYKKAKKSYKRRTKNK